jgi:hypothetical protein
MPLSKAQYLLKTLWLIYVTYSWLLMPALEPPMIEP